MKEIKHWAQSLEVGDRCLATIRHKTDGSKNLINQSAIVVVNNKDDQHILVSINKGDLHVVPYSEIKTNPFITTSEIRQESSNKLIAEFMGMKQGIIVDGLGFYHPNELEYHTSWDWLMPVIEKIASMSLKYRNVDEYFNPFPQTFGMKNKEGLSMFRFHVGFLHCNETLIGAAYSAVVEFLEGEKLSVKGDKGNA